MRLLEPLRVGPLTLPNRVVMAPLTRCRSAQPGNVPTELNARYYAQRASAGLIVGEATQVCPEGQGYLWTPGIFTPEQRGGWRTVTEAVHAAGGRIHAQLWHVGRISHRSLQPGNVAPVSCGDLPSDGTCFALDAQGKPGRVKCDAPRALRGEEIPEVIEAYRHAARVALEAGFDGVQVHGANGYLPDQFLSSVLNRRSDAWGGSVPARARFLMEIVRAVAGVWGSDRVGVRLSPHSGDDATGKDTEWREQHLEVARQLQREGVAYVDLINYAWAYGREGFDEGFLRDWRTLFRGAIMVSGGLERDRAEALVSAGLCDACVFGRPFIANPDLPERLRRNLPLAKGDESLYYGGAERGYTDYPRAE
ncbi:MAG: alkene reductase [Planctomycetes bacterium]|nr:alkene reductase [Planctomycetota bacterium]